MAFQNIAGRLVRDLVAEVGQGTHDSILTPARVVFGHADDEFPDCRLSLPN